MSHVVSYKLPCHSCGSSDAYHTFSDGHGYCFSCSHYDPPDSYGDDSLTDTFSYQYLPWRGITRETMEKYDVRTKVTHDGTPVSIGFPYGRDRTKVRLIDKKEFTFVGDKQDDDPSLFGQNVFSAGSVKYITITEGELDSLSVFQILGGRSGALSCRSASSALGDCKAARDYLNSFERIYLCFDNDAPGEKAKLQVASLFDYNKVYDVKLTKYKDANEYLSQADEEEFRRIWWNARKFQPEGIVSTTSDVVSILSRERKQSIATYPFRQLQDISSGIRLGERVLFTALEGIGKTEYVRAIEHHILSTTDLNLGIIHLEEPQERSILGLIGYEYGGPCHLSDCPYSIDELTAKWKGLVKRDERVHFYKHFDSADLDTILDRIRFMVSVLECKIITLDHISWLVAEEGDKVRLSLDYLTQRINRMVDDLGFSMLYVSHVNDDLKTRDSRNISKIADLWVHIDRNPEAEDELTRNTSYLKVKKNRVTSLTGPAGKLYFNPKTFMLSETPYEPDVRLPPVEV